MHEATGIFWANLTPFSLQTCAYAAEGSAASSVCRAEVDGCNLASACTDAGGVYCPETSVQPFITVTNVRKTPSWPRSRANFSMLQLYSRRNAWANWHLLGQPNTFLAKAAPGDWLDPNSSQSSARARKLAGGRQRLVEQTADAELVARLLAEAGVDVDAAVGSGAANSRGHGVP